MKLHNFIILLLFPFYLFAQKKEKQSDEVYVDNHYFEDQFYLGVQYNSLVNTNNGIKNNGVPFSIQTGFIKDIPLNTKRNRALGVGIGYSFDVLRYNVVVVPNGNALNFKIDNSYSRYDYSIHSLEIPFEYRWRTSTSSNNAFWRIYTGVSFVYNINNKASFDDGNGTTTSYSNLPQLNKSNYTMYTSIGFGTWNLHLKYYLKPPFKDYVRTTDGQKLNFNQLKIGVMFYIL